MNDLYPWQKNDWDRLRELRRRPPHGLLFKGPGGIGKFELAMRFATSLLCERPGDDGMACGSCPSCRWFAQGSHPDFRLLQPDALNAEAGEGEAGKKASKQIAVDQIRALSDFLGMTAHQGGRRVVVVHPAEAMNSNAANALLKSLEEPPPGLLFILVSHKPQQLLATLLSRCQAFPLTAPDAQSAANWLAAQGLANPADALAASGFAPLTALDSAGQAGNDERGKLLRAVREPGTLDVFALAEALQKTEQVRVVQWLQQWCYDLAAMKLAGSLRYHPGDEAVIGKLVASVDALDLARMQKHLQTAQREAQHTLNPRLFLESLFLSYRQLMLG